MPISAAIAFWLSPSSRRRRRTRPPRKSLRSAISVKLSQVYNVVECTRYNWTSFGGAFQHDLPFTVSTLSTSHGAPMTDFSSLVPASAGRFEGIERPYTPADVERLRGSIHIEHSLARRGAERLWGLLRTEDHVHALGALTGNQAMQMVR